MRTQAIVNGSPIDYHLAVISARRSGNVAPLEELMGQSATWYVADGEGDDYRGAGAGAVIESGLLCASRNAALDDAFELGMPCVQVDDDLRWLRYAIGIKKERPLLFDDAVSIMMGRLVVSPFRLAGVAPTSFIFYFSPKRRVQTVHFCVGDLLVILPDDLRFDERMRLKEDYDFTCQHLEKYGGVVRSNDILANFLHRNNPGGAVAYRDAAAEKLAIAHLNAKWPGAFRPNPRRKNEVLMKWKNPTIDLPDDLFPWNEK